MTVLDLLHALRRHPVVLVLCLVASINAGVAVWLGVPTSYQAESSLVLLSPENVLDGNGKLVRINPWDRAGDNASQVMASALSSVANSPNFVDTLEARGVTSATSVDVALSGGGVVLNLTAVSRDSASASADLTTLSNEVQVTLAERQRQVGAPANSLLRAVALTEPGPPLPLTGSRIKLAGVTIVLALIFSVLAVLLVDARARRWAARLRKSTAAKKKAAAYDVPVAATTKPRPVNGGSWPVGSSPSSEETVRLSTIDNPPAAGSRQRR